AIGSPATSRSSGAISSDRRNRPSTRSSIPPPGRATPYPEAVLCGDSATLALAPFHEIRQRRIDGRIDRWRSEIRKELLIERIRFLFGGRSTRLAPGLEIAPIGDYRGVEGMLVAGERVGGPEKMATGADIGDGLQRQSVVIDGNRRQEFGHHLQQL